MDYEIQHKVKIAKEFESQGKLLHSINIYKSLIDARPEFTDAYFYLADLYEKIGSYDAANSLFQDILHTGETENEFKIEYGKFLMRIERIQDAVDIFKKVPSDEEPICSYYIGYLNLLEDNFEEAKVHLLNFVISEDDPELIYEAFFYLAKTEFELKQFENSLRYIKKAETLYSDYWEMYLITAQNYYSLSMYSHAEKNIAKALKLKPGEVLINYWAGKIYYANSDFNKAVEYYTNFLKFNERINPEQLHTNAISFIKRGGLREALVNYKKAKIFNSNLLNAEIELQKSKTIINKNQI